MSLRWSQIAIIVLLVANLAGCAFAAHGAALFCLASDAPIEWFTYAQGVMLLAVFPVLAVALLSSRFRTVAAIVGALALIGLAAQQVLLDRNVLYCDAP